ncbi:hypothetical protein CH373_17335 [Leptospira perolatii]|uniref:N-formylglutamate amidohydrolase n=1 Tax=Leptospira perolatii TaxID=2023191 RepID=A0A2M9ZIT4_9LEPT|nr:hypothetical protein [Leptospira perolatii]PJZ68554.1 hypothetical protein CH360_15795 [Leptospira perolatii]PJZ71884.1 hypothetical protein CH373_17335 [Leptospira perolatii]
MHNNSKTKARYNSANHSSRNFDRLRFIQILYSGTILFFQFALLQNCNPSEKPDGSLFLSAFALESSREPTNCIPSVGCGKVLGLNGWVEIQIGELPIILTSPHGGTLTPTEMGNRTIGTLGNDSHTIELTFAIREEIVKRFGKEPTLVINHVDRSKVDMNRARNETVDDETSDVFQANLVAYNEFHLFAKAAKDHLTQKFAKGLLVDVHGHGQSENVVQLGFNLTESEIESDPNTWAATNLHRSTNIEHLIESGRMTLQEALIGDHSLGTLLTEKGFSAFPSRQMRDFASAPDNHYFTGGYISDTYGSRHEGALDAFQMETPGPNIRNEENLRIEYAKKFVESLQTFLEAGGY